VHGLPSGGCGDLTAEREFLSDKVFRHDPRRVIGVEPFCLGDVTAAAARAGADQHSPAPTTHCTIAAARRYYSNQTSLVSDTAALI
jgi:hypothetical protein